MPRFYRPIGFYSISFETWVTLVENVECWVIWMWWSDGLHIIVEEELGDDTLVDVGVGTQGYSGLVTPADIRVLTPIDTGVHTIGGIGLFTLEDIGKHYYYTKIE